MNKKRATLAATSAAVALVGCASPAPVPVNFEMSHQKVARTAQHWQVVADDVVSETLRAIVEKPQLQGRGLYVEPTMNTAFNSAFRDFMITNLVNRGAQVSVCKEDPGKKGGFTPGAPDIQVVYDVQHIRHARLPQYQPPGWTLLASGVAVVRNVIVGGDTTAGIIGGVALGEWGLGHLSGTPSSEIIVTTTIAENNRFVARKSDIYYVPESDAALFIRRVAQRSLCEDGPRMAMAADQEQVEAEKDLARRAMVERMQARTNKHWVGPAIISY